MGGAAILGAVAVVTAAVCGVFWRDRRLAAAARAAQAEAARLRTDLDRCKGLLGQTDRLSSIGMLAASVAHEVRNPLVSVRTFAQLLPERLQDEEFRTSFRELALGEIDRISMLMNDLLAFARPAAPDVHETDINGILDQIRRLVEGEARKRALDLSAELDPKLPPVAVDEARVKQVFLNVVLNAIHACEAGGCVRLRTCTVRDRGTMYLQVEVRDSGRGIPDTDIGRIFDPFFTTKEGGSGLGLFIAQRIVRDHGGFIEVTSAPGRGSVFSVHFPLSVAAAAGAAGPEAASGDANDRPHRSVP